MMLGFGGINYTAWLYMSWMPNYLESAHHVSIGATGAIAIIPFFCGGVGMFTGGVIGDFSCAAACRPSRRTAGSW